MVGNPYTFREPGTGGWVAALLVLFLSLVTAALLGCVDSDGGAASRNNMKNYRVVLEGKNFLLDLDGTVQKHGFFTTRYVQASDEEEAELNAVDLVRNDDQLLTAVKNEKTDPPMIYLDEIEELDSFEGIKVLGAGYSFYTDDGSQERPLP